MKRTISKRFELNSIEAELLRLKAKQTGISEGYLSSEELNWFRSAYGQMVDLLVEIKRIVSSARYYASSAYEWWLHQTDLAKANGTTPPKMTEY